DLGNQPKAHLELVVSECVHLSKPEDVPVNRKEECYGRDNGNNNEGYEAVDRVRFLVVQSACDGGRRDYDKRREQISHPDKNHRRPDAEHPRAVRHRGVGARGAQRGGGARRSAVFAELACVGKLLAAFVAEHKPRLPGRAVLYWTRIARRESKWPFKPDSLLRLRSQA